MTPLLQWRIFEKADCAALARFVCTEPASASWDGHKKVHPRPWELDVQSLIRTHKPNARRGEFMLLGLDHQGAAAVAAWKRQSDPGQVLLQLIAVAMRYRGCGRACSKETIETTMTVILDQARRAGSTRLLLEALIDRRNEGSKRMCSQAGFAHDSDHDEDLELWAYYTDL